eukprot:4185281-Amphidinium_carterae.1
MWPGWSFLQGRPLLEAVCVCVCLEFLKTPPTLFCFGALVQHCLSQVTHASLYPNGAQERFCPGVTLPTCVNARATCAVILGL